MILAITILLGILPGLVWLIFYVVQDPIPEPKRAIFKTVVFGAAFAFFTLAAQLLLRGALDIWGATQTTFVSLFVFALIEEVFKFAACYTAIANDPAFDEPVDAMVYMVAASVGFATVENFGVLSGQHGAGPFFQSIFATSAIRFIGATLLHTLASALVGFYWGLGIQKGKPRPYSLWGLGVATCLHAFFNFLIITYGDEHGSIVFPVLFVIIAGFFILHDFEQLAEDKVNF